MSISPQKRAFKDNRSGCIALYLCHFVLAPEAGVVQRCVSMLVDCIGVGFALNQLEFTGQKVRKIEQQSKFSPLRQNVAVYLILFNRYYIRDIAV